MSKHPLQVMTSSVGTIFRTVDVNNAFEISILCSVVRNNIKANVVSFALTTE